ncbi:MaoC family dehydratase [Caballeronia sp. LP006]|uniref:MaoC family dehydratase n=1 Tax=Caballeronia sp. LP006 TaxID=3038552 RepID=UPI00285A7F81|nr:MaoC family dehydratase [Caballeronia sp. LP006]MDR5826284.1 MaoC family dehydratase [Caballeronia sp. LP006]
MNAPNLRVGDISKLYFPEITTTDIVKYACASGDFNPLHFDHLYATSRGMDGVVAHGMLSMGLCASGIAKTFGHELWLKKLDARFTAPVYAGMSVEIEYEVLEAMPKNEWLVSVRAHAQGKSVIVGSATLASFSN